MGKGRLEPWDLLAPPPARGGSSRRPFKEGLGFVREALAMLDSSAADFIDTMEKNSWIEGRVLPAKQQGAFCTRFPKSRAPRVYQTYMGSISDIRTLAHELGHAYHGWVMRDLPLAVHRYPMTLAETASVFAETAFADRMMKNGGPSERFEIAWQNSETAAAFLVNIPARFEFERSFYESRKAGALSPEELSDLTEKAWNKWYGDTLTSADRRYWMTKLHFSMAGISFYNFPYTFGYLFSLGVYSLREEKGEAFLPAYIELLRDTGRMTAEELAMKHLGEDLTKPDFWKKSLKIVKGQIDVFETLLIDRDNPRMNQ